MENLKTTLSLDLLSDCSRKGFSFQDRRNDLEKRLVHRNKNKENLQAPCKIFYKQNTQEVYDHDGLGLSLLGPINVSSSVLWYSIAFIY